MDTKVIAAILLVAIVTSCYAVGDEDTPPSNRNSSPSNGDNLDELGKELKRLLEEDKANDEEEKKPEGDEGNPSEAEEKPGEEKDVLPGEPSPDNVEEQVEQTDTNDEDAQKKTDGAKNPAGGSCVGMCEAGCMYEFVDDMVKPAGEGQCADNTAAAKEKFNGCLIACRAPEAVHTTAKNTGLSEHKRSNLMDVFAESQECRRKCRRRFRIAARSDKKYVRKTARDRYQECNDKCPDLFDKRVLTKWMEKRVLTKWTEKRK